MKWIPIKEYFKNLEKYDWVLVHMYDPYLKEYLIPRVAEYRQETATSSAGWYEMESGNLLNYPVVEFFDMKLLDSEPQFA